MAKKEKAPPSSPAGETVDQENRRYRVWMTWLFWTGLATIGLKEWTGGSWEDVAGAWSLLGVISYVFFKKKPPVGVRLPAPAAWWRMVPAYAISAWLVFMTVVRYWGGADDPPMWVIQVMGRWRWEPDRDWLGMALALVLLMTIITRETSFTGDPHSKGAH